MKQGVFAIVAILLIMACGDGNVKITPDPQIQLTKDSAVIADYMRSKGYDNFQTTSSGVKYIILDEGSGTAIDESDFVDYNYTGFTLEDVIFDSSLQKIGDSLKSYYEENPIVQNGDTIPVFTKTSYKPLLVVYSQSGWTMPKKTVTTNGFVPGFVPGFVDGLSAAFKGLKERGKVIIIIPSALAYGTEGSGVLIPSNTPIGFELSPVSVQKQ